MIHWWSSTPGTLVVIIQPKSESPGSPDSANYFEFSTKRLAENVKTTKFALFVGLVLYWLDKGPREIRNCCLCERLHLTIN